MPKNLSKDLSRPVLVYQVGFEKISLQALSHASTIFTIPYSLRFNMREVPALSLQPAPLSPQSSLDLRGFQIF